MNSRLVYLTIAIASIATAVLALTGIHYTHPIIPLPPELFGLTQPSTEQIAQITAHLRKNDTLSMMIFSALMMIAGAPLYTRSMPMLMKIVSSLVAIGLGGGAGWLVGWVGFYSHDWLPIGWDVLVRVMVRLTLMMLPLALLAVLVTVIGTKSFKKLGPLLIAALLASASTALAYTLITATLLPQANADSVLPYSNYCRLLLFGLAPMTIWLMIAHQFFSGQRSESPTPVALEVA